LRSHLPCATSVTKSRLEGHVPAPPCKHAGRHFCVHPSTSFLLAPEKARCKILPSSSGCEGRQREPPRHAKPLLPQVRTIRLCQLTGHVLKRVLWRLVWEHFSCNRTRHCHLDRHRQHATAPKRMISMLTCVMAAKLNIVAHNWVGIGPMDHWWCVALLGTARRHRALPALNGMEYVSAIVRVAGEWHRVPRALRRTSVSASQK
jgi:hypothetical protein